MKHNQITPIEGDLFLLPPDHRNNIPESTFQHNLLESAEMLANTSVAWDGKSPLVLVQATSRDNTTDTQPPIGLCATAKDGVIHGTMREKSKDELSSAQQQWNHEHGWESYWRTQSRWPEWMRLHSKPIPNDRSDNWYENGHPQLPESCRFPRFLTEKLLTSNKRNDGTIQDGDIIEFRICKKETDGRGVPVRLSVRQQDYTFGHHEIVDGAQSLLNHNRSQWPKNYEQLTIALERAKRATRFHEMMRQKGRESSN